VTKYEKKQGHIDEDILRITEVKCETLKKCWMEIFTAHIKRNIKNAEETQN